MQSSKIAADVVTDKPPLFIVSSTCAYSLIRELPCSLLAEPCLNPHALLFFCRTKCIVFFFAEYDALHDCIQELSEQGQFLFDTLLSVTHGRAPL
jgi:hypothetical protein